MRRSTLVLVVLIGAIALISVTFPLVVYPLLVHPAVEYAPPDHHHVLFLHWTPLHGLVVQPHAEVCSSTVSYSVTTNKKSIRSATAVIISDDREDINVSGGLPRKRDPQQPWVLRYTEPPESYDAPFDLRRPKDVATFNLTISYRRDADGHRPYSLRFPWESMQSPPEPTASKRSAPVAWFENDCSSRPMQVAFVKELMNHVRVDSYGSCLHNTDEEVPWLWNVTQRKRIDTILRSYRFVINFERNCCDDYVTPIFFRALQQGVVPVVMGAPNIAAFAPSANSIVNVADFGHNATALGLYLKRLSLDDGLYDRFHEWKSAAEATLPWSFRVLFSKPRYYCRLAVKVLEANRLLRLEGEETHPRTDSQCACPIDIPQLSSTVSSSSYLSHSSSSNSNSNSRSSH